MSEKAEKPDDVRFNWIYDTIHTSYPLIPDNKYPKAIITGFNVQTILGFLNTPEVLTLCISGDLTLTVSKLIPKKSSPRLHYLIFLKHKQIKVSTEAYKNEISYFEMCGDGLDYIGTSVREIYIPLLQNIKNREGWGEVAVKEIIEKLHSFLSTVSIMGGEKEGHPCLPLPPSNVIDTESYNKDTVHILESSIVIWSKQIKSILSQDPESQMKKGQHPTPDVELEFWRNKNSNLNSIYRQLESNNLKKVLMILDQAKSTYCTPFLKLIKEVSAAREETNDNVKFLRPLEPWLTKLAKPTDFPELAGYFRPAMCTILKIWQRSLFYNTPARLIVLMREICNGLIEQARVYISGQDIFKFIEDEEAGTAIMKLKNIIKLCTTFEQVFHDYKASANSVCPENPWSISNNAIFLRLDSFLERCNDILDLTQTILLFSKLSRIEIGGTKGKTLTTSILQIHADFEGFVEIIKKVPYDIMDVGIKQFDDDFYEFQCHIKELERRLASVLTQGFDDCPTLSGRFKLFDSFEGIIERPIVMDELEKKYLDLILSFHKDVKTVQELFLKERDNPPISNNLPPISGAISWCEALLERILGPMASLQTLNRSILEREEVKEVTKIYEVVVESLKEYRKEKLLSWCADVEFTSQSKLKLPLIKRSPDQTLQVNFDPELVRLLREVKYFVLLKEDIPKEALSVYRKNEIFRIQIANLDSIVDNYNQIIKQLIPVEEPLIRTHMQKVETTIKKGIDSMSWQSSGIDSFLTDCKTIVFKAHDVLFTLKGNLDKIQKLLMSWAEKPMIERHSKPVIPEDFDESYTMLINKKYEIIRKNGVEIHNLLKESYKTVQGKCQQEDWKAYVEYCNNIIISGLVNVTMVSLQFIYDQLDLFNIQKNDKLPMLEIELDLVPPNAVYIPSTDEGSGHSIKNIVDKWIVDMINIGGLFKQLESTGDDYIVSIKENADVKNMLTQIQNCLDETNRRCEEYKQQFVEFDYLWLKDLDKEFSKFIQVATETAYDTTVPILVQFDTEISKYSVIRNKITHLTSPTDIGWLRVNSLPIKQALITYVTRWIYLYTRYLESYVMTSLTSLDEFISGVNKGLSQDVVEGDKETLRSVMCSIRDVRSKDEKTKALFDPLRDTCNLLKKHNVGLDTQTVGGKDVPTYLDEGPVKWQTAVNAAYKKKEEIMPFQNAEVDNIRKDTDDFYDEIRDFQSEFKKNAPFGYKGPIDDAYDRMEEYASSLVAIAGRSKQFALLEDLFELTGHNYKEIDDTLVELQQLKGLWDFKDMVTFTFDEWEQSKWVEINTDELGDKTRDLLSKCRTLAARNPIIKAWQVYRDIEDMVKNMSVVLPLIQSLHSPCMQDRHWLQLATICKVASIDHKNENFSLKDILQLGLHLHVDDIVELVDCANKEQKIEIKLNNMDKAWVSLLVQFENHNESDVKVIRVPDEVVETLEAHQLELGSMISMGRFADYFRDTIDKWQHTLGTVETVLKNWMSVTQQWSSLESIFLLSEDIAQQLPEDTAAFKIIDAKYKEMMLVAVSTPNVIEICTFEGRADLLEKDMLPVLEKCQKALTEYLDTKKKIYPRFYFVSNVALLDMLSNGNVPKKIMNHLGDCYSAIDNLRFEDNNDFDTLAMYAKDGEVVDFPKPFHIHGNVECWLNDLTDVMIDTLQCNIDQCIQAGSLWSSEKPREQWLFDYPAQSVLAGAETYWSEETEKSLSEFENGSEDSVKEYVKICTARLECLIKLVQGQLTPAERIKIIALITMDVHNRDVVQKLVTVKAEGPASFQWQQQLRFYYLPDHKKLLIKITDFITEYSFEYVGNLERLVVTPLTDRCYITLTLALRLMLGGAPAGPAGTGKTETTKDLARALARPIYVFNCSDQMNYQTMADIFKGLSQTGAWGCFDEFNRIAIEVLSVVASQVKQCLGASVFLSNPANRDAEYKNVSYISPNVIGFFELDGDRIRLIPTTGFFITMNPGYAGRTELPENVKALFRPCAMVKPDFQPICENMLMAEGFVTARVLSIKFVTLYALSGELLSKQHHYDWGLRSIKAVLRVAGALKRGNPEMGEEAVLMRALRDFNTPKMPVSDLPIFLRLIQDLFPESYKLPVKFDEALQKKAIEVCKNTGLQPEHTFVMKVIQYQELLNVRHSVFIIGPGGCGKTTTWKALLATSNLNCERPKAIAKILNPKALTSNELYGYMTMTKEWKDGVISIIMRGMSKNMKELGYHAYQTVKWVVLDGDIDAVWIESMNTVMDDNKVLTLVSNERVPLTDAMRMIFEVNTLKNASPATVSRAGILFINETDIGWKPMMESWIATRSKMEQEVLPILFEKYVETIVDNMKSNFKTIIPLRIINKISTICNLMEGFMQEVKEKDKELIELYFIQATIWAFGGATSNEKLINYRKNFSDLWRMSFTDKFQFPTDPPHSIVLDFYLDPEAKQWVHWSTKVDAYVHSPIGRASGETSFSSIGVKTIDTVRLQYLFTSLTRNGHGAMLVGPAGTGKTKVIRDFLNNTNETFAYSCINMNFYTDHAALQALLEQKIDKRSGTRYGPPPGKKMIYFIDDMNMPQVETYGSQGALALLTLVIDHHILYDRADPSLKKTIEDILVMGSMNPTAGSFIVCERLQRHFATFAVDMPTVTDCNTIYSSILSGHFANFPKAFSKLAEPIIGATLALHEKVLNRFLPSAIKFVYNWNMREYSNIIQGMTNTDSTLYTEAIQMMRLWVHESYRVFGDRLINEKDMEKFKEMLVDVTKQFFEETHIAKLDDLHAEPLIYTSFHNPQLSYLPLPRGEEGDSLLSSVLIAKLNEYNESNSIMDLVLFKEAMEHVTRITRILNLAQGHALLVGVGGSGKQSLAKLGSFICGHEVRQLSISSSFGIADLLETLKEFYMLAGVKNTSLVWIITDSHIVDDRFLVYINDVLSAGYVPNLFAKDEIEGIFQSLRGAAKAAGVASDPVSMMDFFIQKVQSNLHLVLCFSPVGDTLRVRSRRFPGIINCTVIDWFHEWPKHALISVATKFLTDTDLGADEVKDNIANHIAGVHVSVIERSLIFAQKLRRYNYVTPRSFLEMITFYKSLLAEKRTDMIKQIERLSVGLATLQKTSSDVAILKDDLQRTLVVVEEKKAATTVLLEEMGTQKAEAEKQQAAASIEAEKANSASQIAAEIEAQASTELAAAKPAMEAAAKAVDCLDKNSLTELKNFTSPPAGVDLVTNACLMMLRADFKNLSWDKAKKMMKDVGVFMKELKDYPAEEMTENLVKNLGPIINNTIFTPENMKSKSSAAANLCEWVANIYRYNRIYVNVKPLMDRLEIAKNDKAKAEADLAAAEEKVAIVEAKLKELQDSYQTALEEKNRVEEEANSCQKRLGLAERLVNGLSSENTRWGLEVQRLKTNEINIIGDTLLSAAFASYVGGFDASFRNELWREVWLTDLNQREIPTSEGIDPLNVLTNDGAIAIMQSQGLPADRMSIENGCICNTCKRWALLIDPQLQGIKWLRGKYPNATCLQFSMKNWQKRLQNDIQMGRTVILENVQEDIDHTLDPLLARAVYLKGKTLYLKFCGEEIEFAKDFKLILQCKLSNPHYQPEIQAQCTLVNFIATEKGLEDQLLAKVVNEEKPELEQEKQELQKKLNDYKIKLIDLEDTLLDKLSHAPADILSDEPLIIALEETKRTAGEIQIAVTKAKETEIEININRDAYRNVASEGAMLYFMLTTLCTIDHMYQYSLDAFTTFFYKAIHKTPARETQLERVDALRSVLRLTIYTWISRGLYEEHKLIVMTLLTFNLMQRKVVEVEYTQQQMLFLKRAPTKIGEDNSLPWLSTNAWNTVQALAEIDEYRRLPNDMIEAAGRFQEWFTSSAPEDEKLPLDWSALDKTFFQKMLVVRALRPDRMTAALNHFIRITLPQGDDFADCDATYSSLQILEQCLVDSNNVTPIYFILSPGTDVATDLDKLALSKGKIINQSYHSVSMGQGQDGIAMRRLDVAHKEGHWVVLHNVHLMPRWLSELEKKLDEFALEGSHDEFRVFLTSDPSPTIPIGILNRCIKLTNEPPTGLRANLKRAFCSLPREGYDEGEGKVKCITFALCHFHAVLIERKKFGSKGFNMIYPFNLGDLRDSRMCLLNYMSENSAGNNIPWDDLRYIFGQIMYGGHIVNDLDRVLCMTYLDLFMRDEILDEAELLPFCEQEKLSFKMPLPTTYDKYIQHINDNVKFETPLAYGLHPNAEIDFKTTVSNNLFRQLQNLESQGGDTGDTESAQSEAEGVLQDILEKFGETYFNLEELPIEEKGPYQNVFLQECEHINVLAFEMRRSLNELAMGFAGELTMSEQMDTLFKDLYLGDVPESWSNLAWPSMRTLPSWIKNLEKRIEQLRNWCGSPMEIPVVTWISGFANPQSFLTAILQQTAQKSGQALDCLITQTDVTKHENYQEIEERTREGAYIYGLFLQGARWDTTSMIIDKSLPREMFCTMPTILVKAVSADKAEQSGIYQCPVFRTEQRGPTFVCFAQLRTKSSPARWILAGASMIMDIVE